MFKIDEKDALLIISECGQQVGFLYVIYGV